jgi:dimethylhistidine N-methyltransferase
MIETKGQAAALLRAGGNGSGPSASMVLEVTRGLTDQPKHVSPKWFYDARGSELFEEITRLPEYYVTRTEQQILSGSADEIVSAAGSNLTLIELGAGTATKTGLLIEALLRRQLRVDYIPIDVSSTALESAALRLRAEFPRVRVQPQVADFTNGFGGFGAVRGRKLVLFIGSSIGNFEPTEAVNLLARLRGKLASGDAVLLGTDLVKDRDVMGSAYDDGRGVTAEFNKNLLVRLNREMGANFDLKSFRHVALWNENESRMEMYLESTRDQSVTLGAHGLKVQFAAGERIHTENSYKYTIPRVEAMLRDAGFQAERHWTDPQDWFAVHLARVP